MQCWNTYIPCVFAYASLKSGVQKMSIWIKFCLLLPSLILIVNFSFFVKLHCMTLPPLHYYPFPLSYITFEQFNPIHCLRSWKWSKDKYNVYIITTVWNFSGIKILWNQCVKWGTSAHQKYRWPHAVFIKIWTLKILCKLHEEIQHAGFYFNKSVFIYAIIC